MKPELLILCSSFNRPRGLLRAIESVHRQTFKRWMLVICDDGSDDDTRGVISRAIEHPQIYVWDLPDPRPPGYRAKVNTLGQLLNHVLADLAEDPKLESIEFVTYIGDGITYVPDRCERRIAHLRTHAPCSLVWGHQVLQRVEDEQVISASTHRCGGAPQIFGRGKLSGILAERNVIDHYSVTERVEVSIDHPWSEDPAHWHDLDRERWRRVAAVEGFRADMLPEIGEFKRTSGSNLGILIRSGKSPDEIAEQRAREARSRT